MLLVVNLGHTEWRQKWSPLLRFHIAEIPLQKAKLRKFTRQTIDQSFYGLTDETLRQMLLVVEGLTKAFNNRFDV